MLYNEAMKIKRPYFMSKKEWYYFDNDASGAPNDPSLKLTELGASIPDVLESYDDYFEDRYSDDSLACGE